MEQEVLHMQYELKQLKKTVEELPNRIDECINGNATRCTSIETRIEQAEAKCEKLAEAYNKAIQTINDLSERLTALESNYDPTVIK